MRSRLGAAARILGVTSGARALEDSSVAIEARGVRMFGQLHRELATFVQAPRLLAAVPRLASAPRAPFPGHVVVDVPGWRAPEAATAPLRAYLTWLGYDARPWGFGVNRGDARADARRLADRVADLAAEHGPVSLVGWSLGGAIVREVARSRPDSVAGVITYGSPVYGRGAAGQVPVTVLFSRRDGIVPWRSSIDHRSGGVEHIEVGSTHLGLGFDPDVWQVVAERLARNAARAAPAS